MHSKSVDSLSLTRAGFIEYFLVATKLVHALTAIAPALFLLYYPGLVPVELRSNMLGLLLFFGALTVIMFQALDVYSDDIFSNRLRFRIMFFAWASAFCLLLFMYQGLGLFPYLSSKLVIFWFTGSLLLFGVQRLLVLRLYRAWMKRGMYLQRTVILGFTESGMHLAEYLVRNHDIRSGIIGFIDDRSERVPENYNSLPLLGNTKDLEKLIRQEQVDQVLVALPWFAEGRIGAIVHRLRQLPVNVLLVPDMAAFRHAHNRIVDVSGIPMFNASELPLRGWSPLIKRCEDLVLASIALVLFAPLMALVALAIRLDSKGPVLFRQKRYGYNNRLIWVFKFRSMYTKGPTPTPNARPPATTTASPGSAASSARPASTSCRSCSTCSPAACRWSARAPTPPRPRPPAFPSRRRSANTARATGSSPASPAGRRSTATAVRPTPCTRSRNAWNTTSNTSPSGRCGSTSTSCSVRCQPYS